MSLMLRKSSEEILEQFKLQNFHVTINESTHNLSIVSECGNPFVTITGITFNRMQPTYNEINYAIELLENFLATHRILIDNYLLLASKFNKLNIIEKETANYKINHYGNALQYSDNIYKIEMNKSDDDLVFGLIKRTINPIEVSKYKFDKRKFNEAKKYFNDYINYKNLEEELDNTKTKISVCNI